MTTKQDTGSSPGSPPRWLVVAGFGAAISLSPLACSGEDAAAPLPALPPGAGGGGAGGSPGLGGASFGDAGQNDGADVWIDPDAACATSSEEATLSPLNMFVMFDRSGSMEQDDKWTNATQAMVTFFESPASAGLGVALRFFPHDEPVAGCDSDNCSIPACATPLVALGTLSAAPAPGDAHEAALVSAIEATNPNGATPMYAALGGALEWAKAHQSAHPAERTVVVLVTDGEPNGCEEAIDAIAGLAASARSSHGVLTFAIGLAGSSEAQMDQIALAGGTDQGFFIGAADMQADLLAAFQTIQGKSISCEFAMPTSKDPNEVIDPAKVNVIYTPGGSAPSLLAQVADAAACTSVGGWYYDDPGAPTSISLCPSTCAAVQADPDAKIEIVLGCATNVAPPK